MKIHLSKIVEQPVILNTNKLLRETLVLVQISGNCFTPFKNASFDDASYCFCGGAAPTISLPQGLLMEWGIRDLARN